jgi:hypothetical protein
MDVSYCFWEALHRVATMRVNMSGMAAQDHSFQDMQVAENQHAVNVASFKHATAGMHNEEQKCALAGARSVVFWAGP